MKQAKPEAIQGRKAIGSLWDSQLPWSSWLFSWTSQTRSNPAAENY